MAERQRVVERGQAGCPVEDLIRASARLFFTARPRRQVFRFGFSIRPSIVALLTNKILNFPIDISPGNRM
jgi:hypothetical protein